MENLYLSDGTPRPIARLREHQSAWVKKYGGAEAPWMPPAEFYMGNYMLDGCESANLHTAFGYYRDAAKQILSFTPYQRPNGMVPGVIHPPKRWSPNPERWLSTKPFEGNDYPQSPVWAYATLQLHEAASAKEAVSPEQTIDPDGLLWQIYPSLRRFYMFFANYCQVSETDPRVFLLHPHQDNRDSDPSHDRWKEEALERQLGKLAAGLMRRKPRTSEHMSMPFNYRNVVVDYLGALATNLEGYQAGWEPARIHETSEYVDVWYNCLLYENYLAMSELAGRAGETEDAGMFAELAHKLEQAIIDNHYFPEAHGGMGAFYAIYNGQPQRWDTVGNLVAPLLRNLPAEQLESNHQLTRKAFFEAPYVLPCIALHHKDRHDPHHEEVYRHWGTTAVWVVANSFYMRSQLVQANRKDGQLPQKLKSTARQLFDRVQQSNQEMVERTGDYAEHFSHLTGLGNRLDKAPGHAFGALAHYPSEEAYISFGY